MNLTDCICLDFSLDFPIATGLCSPKYASRTDNHLTIIAPKIFDDNDGFSRCVNFVARYFPDSEPGWAQLGFERASPVCLVLARLGNVRDLTGINIATGFERGPAGPAQTAR